MKRVNSKKRKRGYRSLLIDKVENIPKEFFSKHYDLITEAVGKSPGIYALYDENELYYVGKSNDLKRRIKHHLHDRHLGNWTHLSLFLVRRVAHIGEIESLVVAIADPKGNRAKPKGKTSGELKNRLLKMLREQHKIEYEELKGKRRKKLISTSKKKLKGLVLKPTKLYRTYKGKDYTATLNPDGTIKIANKTFRTPSAAAKTIIRRPTGTVNGWRFWYIKDHSGELVRLCDYKK